MIPATYPTDADGNWKVYNVSASGRTAWVDYIPVVNVDGDSHWDNVGTLFDQGWTDLKDSFAWVNFGATIVQDTVTSGSTGGGAFSFNGTNDWSRRNAIANLFAGDFTIEARVRPATLEYSGIWGARNSATSTSGWSLITHGSNNKPAFSANVNGVYDDFWMEGTALSLNVWQHIAITREGNTFRMWQDGVMTDERVQSGTFTTDANFLVVGSALVDNTTYGFHGLIDWARITKAARYTAEFSPPTTTPPTSAGLVAVADRGKTNDAGAINVNLLSSVTGLVAGVDYTPVVIGSNTARWSTGNSGYIPIRPV